MQFKSKLLEGRLIKRYKRFLADIELISGEVVTAHCTNSGSMKSCIEEGAPVFVSLSDNPNRKTRYTWEMIYMNNGWIGINTSIPNILVFDALKNRKIDGLTDFETIKREVKFGDSRFDIYAENEIEKCFIEVKNVSMKVGRFARFPDSITSRGTKHLNTLIKLKKEGVRAVMIYIIQREDVDIFGPAWHIDTEYSNTLSRAFDMGVEVIPLVTEISENGINISGRIPFDLSTK